MGKGYAWFDLPRIAKNLVLFPLESVLLVFFLRAAVPAIRQTAESILQNHRAEECDANLMPFKEIIRLIPGE